MGRLVVDYTMSLIWASIVLALLAIGLSKLRLHTRYGFQIAQGVVLVIVLIVIWVHKGSLTGGILTFSLTRWIFASLIAAGYCKKEMETSSSG